MTVYRISIPRVIVEPTASLNSPEKSYSQMKKILYKETQEVSRKGRSQKSQFPDLEGTRFGSWLNSEHNHWSHQADTR